MTYFHEEQPLRQQRLIAVALVVVALVVVASMLLSGEVHLGVAAVALGTLAVVSALFFAATLETTVNAETITVAFHFLWPRRQILLADVRRAAATKYRPFLDYGGYGVRMGFRGWAFNVNGDEGVLVETNDGSHVLIGSQRAQELEAAIARAIREQEVDDR